MTVIFEELQWFSQKCSLALFLMSYRTFTSLFLTKKKALKLISAVSSYNITLDILGFICLFWVLVCLVLDYH